MRPSRAPRLARGFVAASVATFVALLSHVAGGGMVPSAIGIVVPWVFSVLVCTLLAGRGLSAVRLAIAVAASQLLFHTLFVLGTGRASATPMPAGHVHGHAAPMMMVEPAAMVHADASMWVWHAIAAAITVWALHRGESAVRRLRDLGRELAAWARRRLLPSAPVPALLPVAPPVPARAFRGWHVSSVPHLSSVWRRGPPALRVL